MPKRVLSHRLTLRLALGALGLALLAFGVIKPASSVTGVPAST